MPVMPEHKPKFFYYYFPILLDFWFSWQKILMDSLSVSPKIFFVKFHVYAFIYFLFESQYSLHFNVFLTAIKITDRKVIYIRAIAGKLNSFRILKWINDRWVFKSLNDTCMLLRHIDPSSRYVRIVLNLFKDFKRSQPYDWTILRI